MRWIACVLGLMALPSYATTYICVVQNKPVYTTTPIGNLCEISDMDGISERGKTIFAPAPVVSSDVALPTAAASEPVAPPKSDPIHELWNELEYGSYDKVPITPMIQLPKPETVAPPPPTAKPKITPTKPNPLPTKSTVATPQKTNEIKTVDYLPSIPRFNRISEGMLNRRQILQQEIQREEAALNIAREQLAAARKRNDAPAVKKYSFIVLDREQNVLALSRELRR